MPELSSGGVHRRSCGTGTPGTPVEHLDLCQQSCCQINGVGILWGCGPRMPWECGMGMLWGWAPQEGRSPGLGVGPWNVVECGAGMLWDHGVAMLWGRKAVGLWSGSTVGQECCGTGLQRREGALAGCGPGCSGALQCLAEERGEHRHKEGRHWQVQTLL